MTTPEEIDEQYLVIDLEPDFATEEHPACTQWRVYAVYGNEQEEYKIFNSFADSEDEAIRIGQEMAIARQGMHGFLTFECVPPSHVILRRVRDGNAMLENLHKMAQTPLGVGLIYGFNPREHTYEVLIGGESYYGIPDYDVEIID